MKVRVLPREEWPRAEATGAPWMPLIREDDRTVVVVEDGEGAIIASLSVLRTTRFEGVWLHPSHRNGGVGRALLRGAAHEARQRYHDEWVFADVLDEQMMGWVERLGGMRIRSETCVIPLPKEG